MSKSGFNFGSDEDAPTPADDIPVTGTDSIMEVVRNPDYLLEWLTNLEAEKLDKTRQVTGHHGAHTIGENLVFNVGMRRWPSTLRALEDTPHPVTGTPPHTIIRHPRSMLDNLIHLSETDKWRLDFEDYSGLPRVRRQTFEYLANEHTPVSVSDLEATGGTDALIYGPMGRGKTTVVQTFIARLMEINNEAIVWRGTGQRSEWLPFAPWTIACLPEGVEYDVQLAPPEDDLGFSEAAQFDPADVDLEDIVWKVKRYSSIEDLNHNVLVPGAFHVVFPDPMHRGAHRATVDAEETKVLEYTGAHESDDPAEVTPPKHWWFAWLVHHNSFGRSMRVAWVCDEASNIFEDHASNDDHGLADAIKAVSQNYVDFRRNGLSFVLLTQKPFEISWYIRKKMRWAVTLSGASNPVNEEVIGVTPPMTSEFTSGWDLGKAIIWTGGEYADFDWDAIPRHLKVPGKLRVMAKEVRA